MGRGLEPGDRKTMLKDAGLSSYAKCREADLK